MVTEQEYIEYLIQQINMLPYNDVKEVTLKRKEYLVRAGEDLGDIYIMKQGVVITSLKGANERLVNLKYMIDPGIVTLLTEEESGGRNKQPVDVLVDSTQATFLQVNREKFWKLFNQDAKLSEYLKLYYRRKINEYINQIRVQTSNNKTGNVCAFLYECGQLFGKPSENETVVIKHRITQGTIAEFCGITTRNSVSRIMLNLSKLNIIDNSGKYILIRDMHYLKGYVQKN
ncbi:Crp/Fnr family transcriptional regulator [Weissella coleopterorum]|uniref:Crp/Fnr family transcriptional regulator n=1 Tax=Weissella coleopterorum TaxID=2714949 RepID=A0A6G8B135_9LACO|nr:Crp/Fnr family transcriptional regulator [Weissella coleopterorum]QIL51051.1 Crp/Fnr family transcriptional regulator [Weissella coleopterorum]